MPDQPTGRGLTVPKNPAAMLRALNARHTEDPTEPTNKETDQQTNNTTILQTVTESDTGAQPEGGQAPGTPEQAVASAAAPALTKQTSQPTNTQKNKPTKKQTNNTTNTEPPRALIKRDGRTMRARQPVADPSGTLVTSFRISAATMEALDRYCFENRVRKQDVVEQALAAYLFEDEE